MQRIADHRSGRLWDDWGFMEPKRRNMLENSWAGVFREFLLAELPLDEMADCFHESMGRPSKELHTMMGLMVLQQMLDLTDQQTFEALAFDSRWHYALNIVGEGDEDKYVCERTLRNHRRKMIDKGLDRILFTHLTDKLLAAFGVDTSKQRLDSTRIISNMRELSRAGVFMEVIRGFLHELRKQFPEKYAAGIEQQEIERYMGEKGKGAFPQLKPSEAKAKLPEIARDLFSLVERFKYEEKIKELKSYRHMCRVLSEQCKITGGPEEERLVEVKAPKEVSADSLQSTSDPDATYDAHKGSGYQVQLMETYQETKPEEKKDEETPDLITYVEVEPASRSDMKALEPALAETKERGCVPEELLADGGYGSDENVESARKQQVELIAPANKGINKKSGALGLEGFEFDESGEIVRCPCGEKPLKTWRTKNGSYAAHFAWEKCNKCELRKRCRIEIKAKVARVPSYKAKQQRLAVRRAQERSEEYIDKYRWRAGEEATMSRYKSQTGAGRLRVRGMAAVSWGARLKALGLNILRCARAVSVSAISAKTVQAYA